MVRPIPRDAPVTIAVFLMLILLLAASSYLKSVAKKRLKPDGAIRPMHNANMHYACNAATPGRPESPCCVLGTCRRAECIACRQAAAIEPARGEPRLAANARYISR